MMIHKFNSSRSIRIILVFVFIVTSFLSSTQTVFSEDITLGSSVTTIDWKPDGSYGLIGGTGGLIAKYDGKSVLWQSNIQIEPEHIVWRPDGNAALIVGQGGIFLFNGTVQTLKLDPNMEYLCVDWDPTGSYALIGGRIIEGETHRASLLEYDGSTLVDISYLIDNNTNITITHIAWNPRSDLALIYTSDGKLYTMWEGGLTLIEETTDILDFA